MAPGKAAKKAYWHLPNNSINPKDFQLGTILSDPYDVLTILNHGSVIQVSDKDTIPLADEISHDLLQSLSNKQDLNVSVKAVAASLFSFGPSIQKSSGTQEKQSISATNISATCFNPSPAYMKQCLQIPAIVDWIKPKIFAEDLYIVTGRAIADGVNKHYQFDNTGGYAGDIATPVLTGPSLEPQFGASIASQQDLLLQSNVAVKDSCVFSYQVRRFMYNKITRKAKDKGKVSRGAMYGADGTVETIATEQQLKFDGFVVRKDDEYRPEEMLVI